MRKVIAIASLALPLLAGTAMAGEEEIALKDGTGKDLVENNCGGCHSLDYIQMNSPFLDQKKWEGTVQKMIGKFGAPIAEGDVAGIIAYLTANYGAQ